jgi:hypothetical protein
MNIPRKPRLKPLTRHEKGRKGRKGRKPFEGDFDTFYGWKGLTPELKVKKDCAN